jgi:hypothetical protein
MLVPFLVPVVEEQRVNQQIMLPCAPVLRDSEEMQRSSAERFLQSVVWTLNVEMRRSACTTSVSLDAVLMETVPLIRHVSMDSVSLLVTLEACVELTRSAEEMDTKLTALVLLDILEIR